MRNFINAARDLAYHAHRNDKDKLGEPYRLHLKAVAAGVRVLGGSDHAVAAAYLHDVIEDHGSLYSAKKLIDLGFPHQVVKAVVAVTKTPNQPQPEYLEQVIAAGQDAMHVKLADLLHNTRHDRLAPLEAYTRTRLLKKYRPAIARLMLELELIVDEDTQAKIATHPVGTAGSTSQPGHYSGSSLIKGDWPEDWPAPVEKKTPKQEVHGGITYLLTNGQVRAAVSKKQYTVWTQSMYSHKLAKDPDWNPTKEKKWPGSTKPQKTATPSS